MLSLFALPVVSEGVGFDPQHCSNASSFLM